MLGFVEIQVRLYWTGGKTQKFIQESKDEKYRNENTENFLEIQESKKKERGSVSV